MKRVFTKEYVDEGLPLPRGYAVAYRDFLVNSKVCYPLGIHLIVRWARDLIFWLGRVGYPGYRQRHEQALRKLWEEKWILESQDLFQDTFENAYKRGWNESKLHSSSMERE